MSIKVKASPGAPGAFKIRGGTGRVRFYKAPTGGGGGGTGTALDPYILSTDGTPLLFVIDSSVTAQFRELDNVDSPHYGKYATFVCPVMGPTEKLRIRFGIQTDLADNLDTYMYLFQGATYVGLSELLIDQDDDGGSGGYDTFENTKLEFSSGVLTAGEPYVLELTTFSTTDIGNVKVIADVIDASIGVTLDDGITVTNVIAGGTYPYTAGDVVTMDTVDVDKSFTISFGFSFTFGSMPYDLSTGTYPSSGLYTVSTSTGTFDLDVTVPPLEGLVFEGGGFLGPQVITGGESVTFEAFGFGPTPSLTTTLVDTSWTLKDASDVVITTGTLPINNLRTLWTDNLLSTGVSYTMTASGITFSITRTGG